MRALLHSFCCVLVCTAGSLLAGGNAPASDALPGRDFVALADGLVGATELARTHFLKRQMQPNTVEYHLLRDSVPSAVSQAINSNKFVNICIDGSCHPAFLRSMTAPEQRSERRILQTKRIDGRGRTVDEERRIFAQYLSIHRQVAICAFGGCPNKKQIRMGDWVSIKTPHDVHAPPAYGVVTLLFKGAKEKQCSALIRVLIRNSHSVPYDDVLYIERNLPDDDLSVLGPLQVGALPRGRPYDPWPTAAPAPAVADALPEYWNEQHNCEFGKGETPPDVPAALPKARGQHVVSPYHFANHVIRQRIEVAGTLERERFNFDVGFHDPIDSKAAHRPLVLLWKNVSGNVGVGSPAWIPAFLTQTRVASRYLGFIEIGRDGKVVDGSYTPGWVRKLDSREQQMRHDDRKSLYLPVGSARMWNKEGRPEFVRHGAWVKIHNESKDWSDGHYGTVVSFLQEETKGVPTPAFAYVRVLLGGGQRLNLKDIRYEVHGAEKLIPEVPNNTFEVFSDQELHELTPVPSRILKEDYLAQYWWDDSGSDSYYRDRRIETWSNPDYRSRRSGYY